MDQQSGRLRLSPTDLQRWRSLLETRSARLKDLNIPYVFMVAPDAHSVYPEMLPDYITRAPKRPVLQLIDHLAATKSAVRVIYPLDELVATKSERPVYPRTGTHWNHAGAFVAYTRLLDALDGVVAVRRIDKDRVTFEQRPIRWWPGLDSEFAAYENDLGVKVGPRKITEYLVARIHPRPHAQMISDNCVAGRGCHVVLHCSVAPAGTCLVIGDSSSFPLVTYLAETFRQLVFAWNASLDFDLVHKVRPDVVISVMTERFLVHVPGDSENSTHQLEREKRSQRKLRRPLRYWSEATDRGSAPSTDPTQWDTLCRDRAAS